MYLEVKTAEDWSVGKSIRGAENDLAIYAGGFDDPLITAAKNPNVVVVDNTEPKIELKGLGKLKDLKLERQKGV